MNQRDLTQTQVLIERAHAAEKRLLEIAGAAVKNGAFDETALVNARMEAREACAAMRAHLTILRAAA